MRGLLFARVTAATVRHRASERGGVFVGTRTAVGWSVLGIDWFSLNCKSTFFVAAFGLLRITPRFLRCKAENDIYYFVIRLLMCGLMEISIVLGHAEVGLNNFYWF